MLHPTPDLPAVPAPDAALAAGPPAPAALDGAAAQAQRRQRLTEAVATTATKLLPLIALLDAIQPQLVQESVFRARRKKIKQHWLLVYEELHTERPRRQALTHAFQALADLVLEETKDISKDELKQAAKEVALATLKNAPALLNAAHQARLLA
jgi:hypothetical protein